jgi:signal transduction histidine kinase
VHPDDRDYVDARWNAALSGEDYDIEHRIIVDNEIKWVREKAYLEFDENDKPLGGFGITQDITTQKHAEEKIISLSRFPAENPFPVLRLSKDGTIMYSNTPGQELLAVWNCQISQKAPDKWCRLVTKSLRESRIHIERIQCGDRIFSFAITPISDGGYVNLYGRDITVQEQVKKVLRKSRDQLEVQVNERTAELVRTVAILQGEIEQRKHAELRKNVTNSLLELFAQKSSRKEYLDSVVEIIQDWSRCKCVGIRITDDEGLIPYESSVGFSKDFLCLENNLCLHKDACVCIRVITQTLEPEEAGFTTAKGSFHCGNIVRFVDSLSEDEKARNRRNCPMAGFTSIAVVPIRYREEILGVIHLADNKKNKVPVEIVEFLEDMASLIGEAVHRFDIEREILAYQTMLRALASELELAEESERRRIAVDLHDSIGQILAFSRRELTGLEKIGSNEIAISLKEVGRQLDKAIKQTRSLSFELSPSVLYDLGLETALEDLAEIFSRERNIECRFEGDGQLEPIEDAIKVLLYRSVRELLINVAKHADASEVKITLSWSNNEIHINVEDNGKGFDASVLERRLKKSRGFGLFSIQERLSHIDGCFEIQTAEGRGTKITLVAPVSVKSSEYKE